ncbi:hypothetical protein P171DRAFT_98393 [Karstenula rhodostoma CBS 690.94]|uniref:Mid2 domain-containing protein n=1 Tax=Karstenula rhodostoma CBS 690.94 TaxID=1392251 RepID=A0A9P4PA45_9PLEO|nr:hypothetical protein P171DRAFT_98393 [Karstenula rhodostoma CBS 690.94]
MMSSCIISPDYQWNSSLCWSLGNQCYGSRASPGMFTRCMRYFAVDSYNSVDFNTESAFDPCLPGPTSSICMEYTSVGCPQGHTALASWLTPTWTTALCCPVAACLNPTLGTASPTLSYHETLTFILNGSMTSSVTTSVVTSEYRYCEYLWKDDKTSADIVPTDSTYDPAGTLGLSISAFRVIYDRTVTVHATVVTTTTTFSKTTTPVLSTASSASSLPSSTSSNISLPPSSANTSPQRGLIAGLSAGLGVPLVIALVVLLLIFRRRRLKNKEAKQQAEHNRPDLPELVGIDR